MNQNKILFYIKDMMDMLPKSFVLKIVMVLALVCVVLGGVILGFKDKSSEVELGELMEEPERNGGLFLGFGLLGLLFVYMK